MSKRKTKISIKDLSEKSFLESVESDNELKKIIGGAVTVDFVVLTARIGYDLTDSKPI